MERSDSKSAMCMANNGKDKIMKEQVMDKLDMFQSRFGKMDKLDWWDLERISADAGSQFTSTDIKEEFQTGRAHLTLAAPEHQEMSGQVEVTWRTFCTIAPFLMVHAQFFEACIRLH